ncbi:zinc carboxypeptidase [Solirubrobacter pauli]|uniref:Zinc carboxypeptidase n=1 Tax=Solirubrobacter pauli TaxID=166793 RepID=A0A660L1A5_9ACTN|nr:M14 family zinc carboxypeptidase [Solirubrobacter pauli]RKQ87771.1 zinc carboxypeptidase [Solirubrobacter pauli]
MSLRKSLSAVAITLAAIAAAPAAAQAEVDPVGCTQTLGYDNTIPTWDQYWAGKNDPDAVLPLGQGTTGAGGGAPVNGSGAPTPRGRNLNRVLQQYWGAMVEATKNNTGSKPKLIQKYLGKSYLGRDFSFYVAGTADNLSRLDTPDGDAAFWRGVRAGDIPTEVGVEAAGERPAFAWVTATPHGGEAAGAESITRSMYELLARTDCENAKRLKNLDVFYQPVRNPDGRDAVTRTSAFGFDHNRDFGTQNQIENKLMLPEINKYPGLFFIDAHQQSNGYFFPPNEDPVHHEISSFSLNFIQNGIGPALQRAFNDQSAQYQNYNSYDMFTPEYGDTVPSLIMGAAGMTYEKGNSEVYGKQVYDHYLAIDTTINVTSDDKVNLLSNWVRQWGEAVQQGEQCALQPNKLVSPLHDTIKQQPKGTVCGYFFKPGQHTADTAALLKHLQSTGVKVFTLDTPVAVNGYHEFGNTKAGGEPQSVNGQTLPAGTFYIPMAQGMKHWIQAVLGENPFIPYDYFYDVVTWSYPLQRGLSGSGFLMQPLSPGVKMTALPTDANFGTVPTGVNAVYAFNTDSARGLGLAIDLLDKGVNVYRGAAPFTAAGKQFYSGAALVDGASLAGSGVNLATLAQKRNTPVTGLSSFPVARKQLVKPKIGLYTNAATIPSNPLFVSGANVNGTSGHCALTNGGASFCEALHSLAVKNEIPLSTLIPVTSTDITDGKLVSQGFTALINPGSTIPTTTTTGGVTTINATGEALRAFINGGGNYVGSNAGGATSVRSINVTKLNTISTTNLPEPLITPGATFDGTYDTTNPVAWGFDLGGWIYRDSSGNPVFDTATLDGASVVTYGATPDEKYGYESGATILTARPAVVDVPFGSGRSVLIGFNPFYRSWKEQDERLVLNAALYPKGATIGAPAPSPESAAPAPSAAKVEAVAAPVAEAKLTETPRAAVRPASKADRDVRITVKRSQANKLKTAVKVAKLSKSVKSKIKYTKTKTTYTLVVKGVRTSDEHGRKEWVSRVTMALDSLKVRPVSALL